MSQLELKNICKHYKSGYVVDGISLTVHSGQVVGLLGPNGAGKTTCFYMVVGLVPLDSGSIFMDGVDIGRLPMHRRAQMGVCYLPQEASIFRKLSVQDNIMAVLELQDLSDAERKFRLQELLSDLNIGHIRHAMGAVLSGGERRRVEIARCLAADPKLILLDEPFAGIDPIAVLEIQKIIKFLVQRGIGVLITDHSVRVTLDTCDYAYIVNEGRILAAGTPDEVISNAHVREIYLGHNFSIS